MVRSDLAAATSEIARLEEVEAAQAATIEQQQAWLRDLQMMLMQLTEQASRVPELEQALSPVRVDLDASRKEATDKAVEAGRLVGKVEALRVQVGELMAAIRPLPIR